MMIYSDKEVNQQLQELIIARDSLKLGDWDREFIRDMMGKRAEFLSDKTKAQITRIWVEKLEKK